VVLTKFWRKRKDDAISLSGSVAFVEWAVGKDFFSNAINPWDRTYKLLIEIQKRSLAEQVVLFTCDIRKESCRILKTLPAGEKLIIDLQLQKHLMRKIVSQGKIIFWEDLWDDEKIRDHLQKTRIHTILASPIHLTTTHVDILVLLNYSALGEGSRIPEFVTFVSSVLALSLQNARLYNELKKKNSELKDWSLNVEKRIEEGSKKLLEKELQYYYLFEGANDGILVHDASGRILEANQVSCTLFGYDKHKLLSGRWDRFSHSNSLPTQINYFNKVLKKEKVNPLVTILHKEDGSTFHAELSSRRVRFGGKEAIQTFVRNISLRITLEESLRESKEKYRILVESSLVGVFSMRSGTIQFVNNKFEHITGYSKNEIFTKSFFDLIAPEDRQMFQNRETMREKGENVPTHYEVRLMTKSGETSWIEVRSCRVVLDGKPTILGNIIDVTQRKKLAVQLLEARKMESIVTLTRGIAHDFNNLLGGILGYATLLLSDITEDHPHFEDITVIADTAKRAADLTNRLLAFARGGKYQVTSINLNRIINEVIAELSDTLSQSIRVITRLDETIWDVKGDYQQIKQALFNICLNSVEAMDDGGELRITTSKIKLENTLAKIQLEVEPGDFVQIQIFDSGKGMDDRTKSRVFEPFFTTKTTSEGTGLGLSMVYGVVKNHEGAILVNSELKKGTTTTVYFPKFIASEDIESPRKTARKSHGNRILLVDDEKVIREVGKRMLEKGGYKVLVAHNGNEAIDLYRQNEDEIDLVILDLIMPEMGGKETCRQLKEMDEDVVVCFTSGYGINDRLEFAELDERYFIQKPFQTDVLIKTVRDIIKISDL
jgi:two-component system cell cycle sensor histidine kinase/response regulator CckA